MQTVVVETDFIEKASMAPPQDPEGQETMVPDLIMAQMEVISILEIALEKVCKWL